MSRTLRRQLRAVYCLAASVLLLALSVPVQVYAEPPKAGELIDRNNVDTYAAYIPAALKFAIDHGLRARITATHRFDWPAGFQQATEKYSGQASLDEQQHIQNYVAGMPFPLISTGDPQAATKIAYNWRWGPFVPDDVTITSRPKIMAWKTDTGSTALIPDDDERDFRGEESCEELRFLRYSHRTKVDPRPNILLDADLEWIAQGKHCGGGRDVTVTWTEHTIPWSITNSATGFSEVLDIAWFLKWGINFPDVPSQKCSYGCTMIWWDYVAPVNEIYSWHLKGEQPILASLSAVGQPAGIVRVGSDAHFDEQPFEIRNAYVLEGVPVKTKMSVMLGLISTDFISATAYVDSETYLLLGAEFRRSDKVDATLPLWSRPSTDGNTLQMELANEFFVPGDRPDLFLSLNLWPGMQKMNSGMEHIFE
jgi:uncharacterized protein DUF1329